MERQRMPLSDKDLTAPLISEESESREPARPQIPRQESLPLLLYTGSWGAAHPLLLYKQFVTGS